MLTPARLAYVMNDSRARNSSAAAYTCSTASAPSSRFAASTASATAGLANSSRNSRWATTSWPTAANEPRFAWCPELLEMPKPTISAINGVAAGGGLGLALLCDIKMCSTNARLLPIWMKRGIHPDDMITWTLPKLVGYGRALKWLYLAEDIDLEEARATGLIQDVVDPDELMPKALELASRLAAGPTKHMALTKQAVLKSLTRDAWDGVLLESWSQDQALATADREEGVRAFLEKRPPKFIGR